MVQPQQHSIHEHLKEASSFIGNYAAILYASGATTIRIEKNILRMAGEWRMHAEFSILPTDIIISLWSENKEHSDHKDKCKGKHDSEQDKAKTIYHILSSL